MWLTELFKAFIAFIIDLFLLNHGLSIYKETGSLINASGFFFAVFIVSLFIIWFLKRAWHQFWYH